jgi:carboxypeptidase Taq
MGVLHETGHAKYEQSLPKEWRSQPVGKAKGMAFHEGQSLLMEMQICRSRSFLNFAAPFMAEIFESDPKSKEFSPENLYRGYTKVTPSFIRVNADEVTYPLHVILRYEIEKEIIGGTLEAKDLPKIWNEKMIQYLGLSTSENDKDGCMQDGHWPGGAFGYFPSYTIGALIAAQLFTALNKDLPEAMNHIASGNFNEIDQWLREKIWSKGRLLSGDELLNQATGESLNSKYFIDHLKNRYLS